MNQRLPRKAMRENRIADRRAEDQQDAKGQPQRDQLVDLTLARHNGDLRLLCLFFQGEILIPLGRGSGGARKRDRRHPAITISAPYNNLAEGAMARGILRRSVT